MEYTNHELDLREFNFQIFRTDPAAKIPTRATKESAGYDLYSIEGGELRPGETKIFSLGIIVRPPKGYHVRVWGRSGNGSKYNVGIPHGMGLVDRDYCGPNDIMKVVLHRAFNHGFAYPRDKFEVKPGDRIAQMTIEPTVFCVLHELDHPPATTSRGGFGSTGTK